MAQYKLETVRAEYLALWAGMTVKPEKLAAANAEADQVIRNRKRYEAVQATTNVPWFVIGCLHMRESGGRFDRWLHNGDPMRDRSGRPIRTVHEPDKRPPNPNVSWEEGAYDALVTIEQLNEIKNFGPEHVAYASEKFNGWGYRNPAINIPSPYLWGGTSAQKRGKFIADHQYSAKEWDTQLGTMAVLKQIMERCPDARFTTSPVSAPAPAPAPAPVPLPDEPPFSPKATDDSDAQVRPPSRSRVVWGGIVSYVMSIGSMFATLFQYLNNPYTLAAFLVCVVIATVALYLIARGYIDVRKVVEHLAPDE